MTLLAAIRITAPESPELSSEFSWNVTACALNGSLPAGQLKTGHCHERQHTIEREAALR
uniref:Uncharacterized protein n=1 Tax=Ochrobactrum sp. PW1 TaxID=1882222 RepID=A0A292GQN6_9HYPH|nr:hypothetical protein [Ochrobactrum sp. PW1]